MNQLRTSAILTEMSESSTNDTLQLWQKIEILQTENAEFKRRWEASNMLNLTLKQALITISKKGKIDLQLLDKLKQLSVEALTQTSPETLGELRQFYEEEIKKRDYKHSKEIEHLYYKHEEEIKLLREKLERENREKLTREREEMLRQVRDYIHKEKSRAENTKQNKDSLLKNSTSRRRKSSSSSFSSKSKNLNSPINSLETSCRQLSRADLQSEQSYTKTSARGNVATEIECTNCHKVFSTNQFVIHTRNCKSIQLIEHQHNQYRKDRVLKELIMRKQEIEYQLQHFHHKNQKEKRSREVLETDLDEIVYIINNKKELSDQDIQAILQNSTARFTNPKVGHSKKQVIVKRVR